MQLLNENAAVRLAGTQPLTPHLIKLITFHMSFQYGTATNAVRLVPVVYYSSRHASVVSGYLDCKYASL